MQVIEKARQQQEDRADGPGQWREEDRAQFAAKDGEETAQESTSPRMTDKKTSSRPRR